MSENINTEASLTIVVVNCGMASKVLKEVKKRGVTGGTILIGKGIGGSRLSKILGMDEAKKEIILMVINKKIEDDIHEFVTNRFCLKRKNKGILFSINLDKISGIKLNCNAHEKSEIERLKAGEDKLENKNGEKEEYEVIFVVVSRGDAKTVVNAATENGATGGTVLHGRGAGMYENTSLFSMTIEPEKEIVKFLVAKEKVGKIINVIEKTVKIEEPGKGIIFTVPVNKAKGLYEEKNK